MYAKDDGNEFRSIFESLSSIESKKWLAETKETVEAIAKRIGIEDGAYFSRLLKKVEGVTSAEYRRMVHRM
ncbi:helix-turn-helix domain-containing protein [Thermaerobacillus caldiproteolyticus]|uniref:YesN/AraC family two-component response regulator n=1 Tax=Thermaerobacillus caldiproteolyticus TaxID=247480 RepID=A0A7V9Z6B9_9BACL|nr:hypothetical protein [Anoxybacillus caldiproteolyticus]MBA2874867.1 YesN/AraC family two-component response regulator [Anoxybacillus caldiproteolyticus]